MTIPELTDRQTMALKTLVGATAFFLVVLATCGCMLAGVNVDASFLWPVITLIATFSGISAASFAQFRLSDYGAIERKGDADAKVAAATKATPAIVQAPAPAVEVHP